jgi:hypothetical protein
VATVPNPRTWAVGEKLTAARANTEIRDALDFLMNPPTARLTHSATQSATTSTYTAHLFNTETFDTDGIHSTSVNTSRFTIVTTGKYRLSGAIGWAGNATGRRIQAWYKNGVIISGGAIAAVATSASSIVLGAPTITAQLTAGDYVELFGWQDSGGALNMNPGAGFDSFAEIQWVSE